MCVHMYIYIYIYIHSALCYIFFFAVHYFHLPERSSAKSSVASSHLPERSSAKSSVASSQRSLNVASAVSGVNDFFPESEVLS